MIEAQGLAIDESNFPDEVFREYVREFDTNKGGYLSEEEIKAVREIKVVNRRDVKEISTLQGIEYFTELRLVECDIQPLGALDVSPFTMLEDLDCGSNQLPFLDLSQNTEIQRLSIDDNRLEYIDLSMLSKIDKKHIIMAGQTIDLGEIDEDGILLGASGPGMDFICVTYVKGASYDSEAGMLTGYTESPISYEHKFKKYFNVTLRQGLLVTLRYVLI